MVATLIMHDLRSKIKVCYRGGGLVRDSQGNWLTGFAANLGSSDFILALLWCFLLGLKLVQERNFQYVEIELEFFMVVSWISMGSSCIPALTSCITVRWCWTRILTISSDIFSMNAIDGLANLILNLSLDLHIVYSLPKDVFHLLALDCMESLASRGILM